MFPIAATFLVACLVLGGGTKPGFAGDALLQFLAVPVLMLWIWRTKLAELSGEAKGALLICGLLFAVPLSQLIPLPVSWTSNLAAHRAAQETWALTGHNPSFVPISVAPVLTAQSALSLLPPLAVFVTTLSLDYADRRRLTVLLICTGVFSVTYGLAQLAQGPKSPLRFFEYTNPLEAVGFFANRNHFAALCFTLLTLLAAWIFALQPENKRGRHKTHLPSPLTALPPMVGLTAALLMAVTLLVGEITARSRGGIALTMLALIAVTLVFFRWIATAQNKLLVWGSVGGIALIVIAISPDSVLRALARFGTDPTADARVPLARNTLAAAADNPILGTGMGTFPVVYGAYPKLVDEIPWLVANRAHNDYLELYLESGIIGLAVLSVFVAGIGWLGYRLWTIEATDARPVDVALARSAFIIVMLLGVHSMLDYPLRTAALASVLACACGLMIPPLAGVDRAREKASHGEVREV